MHRNHKRYSMRHSKRTVPRETCISRELAMLEQKEKNFKKRYFGRMLQRQHSRTRPVLYLLPQKHHLPADAHVSKGQGIEGMQEGFCRRAGTLTQDGRY